ncbi:hypothetical protein V1506DRAFT_550344 [Lipomyces tetrasporus]
MEESADFSDSLSECSLSSRSSLELNGDEERDILAEGQNDRDDRDDRNYFNDIETQLFNDFGSVLHAIDERAEAHGFAEVARRPSNRYRHTGQYCRYDLECVRGHAKPSRGQGCKKKNYTRLNCPWLAKLVFSKNVGAWIFTFRHSRHSHDRTSFQHIFLHIDGDIGLEMLSSPCNSC